MMEATGLERLIEVNGLKSSGAPCARPASDKWRDFPHSALAHHGGRCCDVAREWVLSIDHSQLAGGSALSGPRWLRQRYTWGPSPWPMHWCEAVKRKTLDCGALASLAHEVFTARGVRSFPAQFIQQYTAEDARHWRQKWDGDSCSAHWIEGDVIYHEGCAVERAAGEIRLWDASAGWWVNPKQFGGYGGVLALRVCSPGAAEAAPLKWGDHLITPNRWHEIERARADFEGREALAAATA